MRLRGLNASGQQTGIREFLLENTCSWQEQEVTVQLRELGAGTVQLQWELYNPSSEDKLYIDELELLSLQVMQEEAYYAYGLAMAGVGSLPGTADHHYLYQGKELENDFDLAWHDGAAYRFHARAFDAQLGRWHAHDPAYQFASPYVGMSNNPTMGVDPDGRAFFTTAVIVATLVSAAIGGTMNVVDNWDNIQSGGDFAAAFTIGAVGGAAAAIATAAVIASGGTALTFGAAALAGATGGGVGALVGDGLTQLGNLAYFGTPFQWDRLGSAITSGIAIGAVSGVLGHWLGKGSGPKPGNGPGKSNTLTPLDQSKMRPMPEAKIVEMPAKTPTLDFFPEAPRAYNGIPTKGISLKQEIRYVSGGAAAKGGLSTTQLVQKSATLAERAVGGTGRFAGTAKHTYANNLLNRYQSIYGSRGLEFNNYFNNGVGNRGFLDVVNHGSKTIYDFKFGSATWRSGQLLKYQRNFPGYNIQIIRPLWQEILKK